MTHSYKNKAGAGSSDVVSLDAYRRAIGRSKTTMWRYRRMGLLETVNFLGKLYLTRGSIEKFENIIKSQEMSREPLGCIAMAIEARAASDDNATRNDSFDEDALDDWNEKEDID